MSSVRLKSLTKRFDKTTVVDSIDLDVSEGEFLVLLGPSGCGKTTTLRCIAGLEDVSGGEILIGDKIVSAPGLSVPPERRAIGMVFQSYAIWPHMTVKENIAFGLKLKRGLSASDIDTRVRAGLDLVGLSGFAEREIHKLSGGQQQRVAVARAVVLEPRVLLFDEPLSNLDAKLREYMRFELRQIQKRLGITSIYVTHDQEEAMVVADRIVLMNAGKIEQIGPPKEIYNRPASLFAADFIGLTNSISGNVVRSNSDATLIAIPGGYEISAAGGGHNAGELVDVLCRPECIAISAKPIDGANAFSAEIDEVIFLGNSADVYVRLGEIRLRAQVSPARDWPAGTKVWIKILPEDLRILGKGK